VQRRVWQLIGAVGTLVVLLAAREEYLAWERHRAVLNAAPLDPGAAGAIILAGSQSTSSVAVVDPETGRFLGAIPVPEGPHELEASPDGRWAVATMPGDAGSWWRPPWRSRRSIAVIDIASSVARLHRVVDLAPHESPHGVVFVDDRIAAVTSAPTRSVVFVDVESGTVLGAVETGGPASNAEPHILAISSDRRRVYSANISSRTVTEIDPASRTIMRQLSFAGNPVIVASAPDGTLWVIEHLHEVGKYSVAVVDIASGSTVARFQDVHLPRRIAIAPDGATAVITDSGRSDVLLFDVATRTLRTRVPLGDGAGPSSVSFASDSSRAFVAVGAGRVVEIDVRAGELLRSIDTPGQHPDGLVYVSRRPR
jgi:DNA-binding beta-propeller fold protein YncE